MKLTQEYVTVPGPDAPIRTAVIRPASEGRFPGVLYYTDIFQLTESTFRTARALAANGFVVVLPELYPRGPAAGVALAFDDEGKRIGLEEAGATTTAQFDADRDAVLGYVAGRADVTDVLATGFCLGGHLAFRAAFDERVSATVCFYPTGLQNGNLGADVADSLARAGEIRGRLMVIFGSADPHVPADGRLTVIQALYAAGLEHTEVHVWSGGEHAFMRDVGPRYDPVLTEHAMTQAVSFFRGR